MKILYIAGAGRSGSTLLEMILGNAPGYFSVGEILDFWSHAGNDDLRCGCGRPFAACPVWAEVLSRIQEKRTINIQDVLALKERFDRTRSLPWMGLAGLFEGQALRRYQAALQALYAEVNLVVGGAVLVDSSKTPAHLYHLAQIPGIEVHVLHLVRDPRAVAFSWNNRPKIDPAYQGSERRMSQRSYINSALRWLVENAFIEAFLRKAAKTTRMRYEDFCEQPFERLSAALNALGFQPEAASLTFLKSPTFHLKPTHSVGGNPVRFSSEMSIQTRQDWQDQMTSSQKNLVTIVSWPCLKKYGYQQGSRD